MDSVKIVIMVGVGLGIVSTLISFISFRIRHASAAMMEVNCVHCKAVAHAHKNSLLAQCPVCKKRTVLEVSVRKLQAFHFFIVGLMIPSCLLIFFVFIDDPHPVARAMLQGLLFLIIAQISITGFGAALFTRPYYYLKSKLF